MIRMKHDQVHSQTSNTLKWFPWIWNKHVNNIIKWGQYYRARHARKCATFLSSVHHEHSVHPHLKISSLTSCTCSSWSAWEVDWGFHRTCSEHNVPLWSSSHLGSQTTTCSNSTPTIVPNALMVAQCPGWSICSQWTKEESVESECTNHNTAQFVLLSEWLRKCNSEQSGTWTWTCQCVLNNNIRILQTVNRHDKKMIK